MTYQELFTNAGQPMPAQFTQFANIEIPADQLPAYLQQYPPVAQPQAPAAPAPAAVPPAPAMPGAPVAAAAPAARTGFDRSNSWPSVFQAIDDIRANGGEVYDMHAPVASQRHPGMMIPRAYVRLKFAGQMVQGFAYTSTKRDAAGNVIGYNSIEDCSQVQIAQDPTMPGRYSFRLTPSGLTEEAFAKATVAKTKPSFNWAAIAETTDAVD